MPQRIAIVDDLGTTKLASDSYDIDNIYLSEEGWVYRHFKSTDGLRYWDEILVAGEVPAGDNPQETNPPKLGTVDSPGFETGDGSKDWEYSEHQVTGTPGTYTTKVVPADGGGGLGVGTGGAPAAGDIGDLSGTAPSGPVLKGVPGAYTVAVDDATDVTFTWTTSDGDGVLSSTSGQAVNITWTSGGNKTVTVTANKVDADDDGATKTYNEVVTEYTIGTVTVTGGSSVAVDTDTAAAAVVQNGNVDDLVYAWSVTSGNAANTTINDSTASSILFQADTAGDYDLVCAVSSVKAAGASGDGTSPVTSATLTVTITA